MSDAEPTVIHRGRFLSYLQSPTGWEYVSRAPVKGAVAILAVTNDQHVVLVEQWRPPLGRSVIELPAGLAGDIPLQEDEPLVVAAKRELKEETGYEANSWIPLGEGASSAGLTDETVTLFYATGLTKVAEGGGVAGENIRIHLIPRREVVTWCLEEQAKGKGFDFKIFAALHLAAESPAPRGTRLWY